MRLTAQSLGGSRGGDPVFEPIDFSLESGEALVVKGANGSGKSTLLKIVAGLLPPSSGSVGIEGADADLAGSSHYLAHENAMKTALTVDENLAFWRQFLGGTGLSVAQALEAVGLGEIGHLPFAFLSTGQRRRTAIARLLVSHRPIWLLDEPTAGLDAQSEQNLDTLMKAHLRGGGILVAATHQPLGIEGASELVMGYAAHA